MKTFDLLGNEFMSVNYSTLNLYHIDSGLVTRTYCNNFRNSFNTAETSSYFDRTLSSQQFSRVYISELDSNFNLNEELKNKVYVVDKGDEKDFFYIKNNNILVHKTIRKAIIWTLETENYNCLNRINLGNNKYVYWANNNGQIYKIGGELKTSFRAFEYYYHDENRFKVKEIDSVDMDYGYFNYGDYKIRLKNYDRIFKMDTIREDDSYDSYKINYDGICKNNSCNDCLKENWLYEVTKGGKILIDNLGLRYYNKNKLIAFKQNFVLFYSPVIKLDSQYNYRTMNIIYDTINFLVGNRIKRQSLWGFSSTNWNCGQTICGNVPSNILTINGTKISENLNVGLGYEKSIPKMIKINSEVKIDSMVFLNQLKEISWRVVYTVDNRIVLYNKGKAGLYEFNLKDSTVTFKEILPQVFDKIYEKNGLVILNKNNKEDVLSYYLLNRNMRFGKIEYKGTGFFRYQKLDKTKGWMTAEDVLYNDL